MGSSGPDERRDLRAARGQTAGGDLASAETPAAEDFDTLSRLSRAVRRSRRIWQDAYGLDYPEEADPFGFVTLTDLRRMAAELAVGHGQVMVDLACGRGGPGLWVARKTGASLVGIDFSEVGIEQAGRWALELGFGERARFLVRDAAATGLPAASFDGAMSVDSSGSFRASEGLLRRSPASCGRGPASSSPPGSSRPPRRAGRRSSPASRPPERGRLALRACEETQDWRRRQLAVYDGILAAESSLRAELGEDATAPLIGEAREVPLCCKTAGGSSSSPLGREGAGLTRRPWDPCAPPRTSPGRSGPPRQPGMAIRHGRLPSPER